MYQLYDQLLDIYCQLDASAKTCDDDLCDDEDCVLVKAIRQYFRFIYKEDIDAKIKQNEHIKVSRDS